MPEGVFQTDRVIFDNPIWKNPAKFRLFFYIYGNAIFSKEGVDIGGIHLSRGQLLKSYRKLSDDLEYLENHSLKKYSISHIKKLIDELVKEERLKMEVSRLGTLFTVLNYEQYQGFERFEKAMTHTVLEHRTNVPLKNLQKLSEFTSVQQRTEGEQPELFDTNGLMDAENTNRERIENTARTEQEQNENNNKNVEECRRKKRMYKDSSLSANKFSDDAIELILASELYGLILLNNPNAKEPNLQTWAKTFDLMIRRDKGRTVENIRTVMNWSQGDSFWHTNILSPDTLRKKFDQLTMKMKSKPDKPKGADRLNWGSMKDWK